MRLLVCLLVVGAVSALPGRLKRQVDGGFFWQGGGDTDETEEKIDTKIVNKDTDLNQPHPPVQPVDKHVEPSEKHQQPPPGNHGLPQAVSPPVGPGGNFGGGNNFNGPCECVPVWLCNNGDINTNGEGLIDIRQLPNRTRTSRQADIEPEEYNLVGGGCPNYLDVCCRNPLIPPPVPPTPPPFTAQCGRRNEFGIDVRIVFNKTKEGYQNEAQYGEYPWMVALLRTEYSQELLDEFGNPQELNIYVCGGSLIHPNVVLTAAHCVSGRDPQTLKIRAGEWDAQTTQEQYPHQDRAVSHVIIHEKYYAGALYNDIALVFLNEPVELTPYIDTICMPERIYHLQPGTRCVATGWGKDSFGKGGRYQNILKEIELPLVDHATCQAALRTTRLGPYFQLHNSFTCAGGEAERDTCKGDGGSPLVCYDHQTQNWIQAGIVAWGINCGQDGIPGVYVDVTKFNRWIDDNIVNYYSLPASYFGYNWDEPREQQEPIEPLQP